ncbi:MAG: polyprenyl synthetase family protein, partial [Elusimicrobia bacterium]|nr:polyprenyl synthetase family protein [Elusimicrobiota bacterium]
MITKYLKEYEIKINKALTASLPKGTCEVSRAMRYSLLAGGKRLRPVFTILGAGLFGGKEKDIMNAALAVEYLHTYSLVHDDLPSMDNDDLRRGKPSCHKKFGETAAILAGDALLTEAFLLVTKVNSKPERIVRACEILSTLSGYRGMIAGQCEDTIAAGNWKKVNKAVLKKKLRFIHIHKTSDLITASLTIGAVLAGADKKALGALQTYAQSLGIAFQIADDILDVYGDKKLLGKKGSDADNDKLTYLSLYGHEQSVKDAAAYVKKAKLALKNFKSTAAKQM